MVDQDVVARGATGHAAGCTAQNARRQLRACLAEAVRPFQTPAGLEFPGVSLVAAGRRT